MSSGLSYRSAHVSARPRLALERLDDRNAPSSVLGNDIATPDWMPNPTNLPDWAFGASGNPHEQHNAPELNQKPKIVNFRVSVDAVLLATYSGTVEDEDAAGLTVMLTGEQGCLESGKQVITDANGNFTFTGTVREIEDAGWAYANVSDTQGQAADRKDFWVNL